MMQNTGKGYVMDTNAIRAKFGDDYQADDQTFLMGIERRFTAHFAARFEGRLTLETCTGAGFTTLALARTARHVWTVEIDPRHLSQATANVARAGLTPKVTFIRGSTLDPRVLAGLPPVEAAFLDPDWAVTGPDHVYRFIDSNTRPPADELLRTILDITPHVALVLPPFVDVAEFSGLPLHERQRLYLGDSHELFCLYFGDLKRTAGHSEFRLPA
jgi:hypothetical protein